MFFSLSKIFWLLATPTHVLAWLVVLAAVSALAGRARAARALIAAAALAVVVMGLLPLGMWLIRDLENRYPRPAWPAHVNGILMLGSGFDTAILKARGVPPANGGELRVIAGFEAVRRYPDAKLVFSGGSGVGSPYPEAETARYVFAQLGLDPARIMLETRSRNTYENILYSKALVKPKPGEVWLLATSAVQMPRAMAVASKLGWPMLPWPTDYLTGPRGSVHVGFDIDNNFFLSDYAFHEWVGLLAYQLAGKASPG